ncbi:MAG: LysM peptidoglycan-binding domain-containing protein [Hyphomicrobiaceae bacterium]
MKVAALAGIVISGTAILAVSATIAWLLNPGVGAATAQSGTQLAAHMPEPVAGPLAGGHELVRPDAAKMAPRVARISIELGEPTVVEGWAPPLASISLLGNGQLIGQTTTKTNGSWQLSVERGLGRGDHRLQVRAMSNGAAADQFSDTVRVSTPQGFMGPLVVSFVAGDDVGQPAEPRVAADVVAAQSAVPVIRVAQSGPAASGVVDSTIGTLRDWLDRADRGYRDVVVKKLSAGGDRQRPQVVAAPATVIAQAQSAPPPASSKSAPTEAPAPTFVDGILNWLKRSSDTYQKSVVKRLVEPTPTLESLEAKTKVDETRKAADAKTGEDAQQRAREELRAAQAKRDAELKAAEAGQKATATAAVPKVEDEATRKAAEDKRIADETMKRQADLKAAEEKRAVAQKAADDKRVADEAAKRTADLKAAEAKKSADEATARDVAARKAADDKRVVDEAAKRATDQKAAEARRTAEDVRLAQEAGQRAAAEAKRAADMARDSELKRLADLKAAEDARQAAAKASNQQADAARAATAKAAEDVRRRAAELAEAASKEATAKIGGLPPIQPEARRSAAVAVPPRPAPTVAPERLARAAPPPARRRPVIDTSTRSSLGAGRGAHAVARRADDAPGEACRAAGRRVKPPGYYVVKDGDSLWDIADLHYGDGGRFQIIERANRRIGDPDMIKPCQRVYIPVSKRG